MDEGPALVSSSVESGEILWVFSGCRGSGLPSGPRAGVKACTERSFQGCKWAASDDENLRATFTFIQGRLEWPELWLRPWSTLTSADWPGATASPDYCLRSSVPKVLNSSHHSNPCCRAPLRPQNALQGSPFEIIYILWSGGFVSLSLMTVST